MERISAIEEARGSICELQPECLRALRDKRFVLFQIRDLIIGERDNAIAHALECRGAARLLFERQVVRMKTLTVYLDNAHGAWIQLVNNAMALIGQLERSGIEVDTLVELWFGPPLTAKTHISGKKQGDF